MMDSVLGAGATTKQAKFLPLSNLHFSGRKQEIKNNTLGGDKGYVNRCSP